MLGFTTFNPACVFDLLPPQSGPELPTPGEIQPCFSLPGVNIRPYPFWLPGYGAGNSPYLGIGPLGTPLFPPGQLPTSWAKWETLENEYGERIKVRQLSDREVREMGLHQEKGKQKFGGKDTIYIDKHGQTWIMGDRGALIQFP